MDTNDIIKPFSELPADADLTNGSWGWGHNTTDFDKAWVEYVDENLNSTIYYVPLVVIQMLKWTNVNTKQKVQDDIKRALGL